MTPPPNPHRPPLSRERALDTAVALADAEGVDAVSMRRLADRLDVVPMALYKHVENKHDLLGGMIDHVIADYDLPDPPAQPSTSWRATLRATILSARKAVLRHPWMRVLIAERTERTPAVLAYTDALAGIFIAGGFSADLTHHTMHVLGNRIWGFSPEAFNPRPGDATAPPATTTAEEQQTMFMALAERYPNIAAITEAATGGDLELIGTGCDEQFEFEFALDLLLDAFERLHAAGWSSATVRHRHVGGRSTDG